MPQADIHYTSDIAIDFPALFLAIEGTISGLDATSGDCKCRAHPVNDFHHSHVLINIAVLEKPHRDKAFMTNLGEALVEKCSLAMNGQGALSVQLSFLSEHYSSKKLI